MVQRGGFRLRRRRCGTSPIPRLQPGNILDLSRTVIIYFFMPLCYRLQIPGLV
jgi:hypothetical protein